MSDLVLVTGATGKIGKSLVALLTKGGVKHRAATRNSERPFDWTNPETWDAALEGVASVFLVAPPTVQDPYSRMIAFAQSAMRKAVRRFVFVSMASLPAGGPAHGQVHQWLKDTSDDWTVLCPTAFMQNFSEGWNLASIRDESTIYSNTGAGRVPFISTDDVASAAFAALTSPERFNRDLVLTGPEALSYDRVAELVGLACGRGVTHTRISTAALIERFRNRGLPEATARYIAAAYQAVADGNRDQTTETLKALTGKPPVTFQAFAEASAKVWERAD